MDSDDKRDIAEYLKFILPDLGDLDAEEVLAQQESVYHYIESNKQQKPIYDHGQSSNNNNRNEYSAYLESQMAYDEALARALEMDDGFSQLYISHPSPDTDSQDNTRSNVMEPHVDQAHGGQSGEQDDIDPDTMTYEELQSLGDAVGRESRGLPKNLISRLPTSKYVKSSKNKEKEECVICCVEFKKGDKVTTLPCGHYYHSAQCIDKWLEVKKYCPVCQKEVQL